MHIKLILLPAAITLFCGCSAIQESPSETDAHHFATDYAGEPDNTYQRSRPLPVSERTLHETPADLKLTDEGTYRSTMKHDPIGIQL